MRAPSANACARPSRSIRQPAVVSNGSAGPSGASSGTSVTVPPASDTYSQNGGYTGGMMTTWSPGSMIRRSISTAATDTSVVVRTRSGSTRQAHRLSAKSAKASGSARPWPTYPVSPLVTAATRASRTGSASIESISATNIGRTSGGYAVYFSLVRLRCASNTETMTLMRPS